MSTFTNATVLITGGSGTFGLACVRQALQAGAQRVVALARGEHRLALLSQTIDDPRLETWVGDVRDRERMCWAMRWSPDIVIHAAALKRIEVCASHPAEAIKTNVDGTRCVVEEAMRAAVPRVVLISSDKACSSETVYGTTKALAEAAALGQNALRGDLPTRISAVRYGNVLGSQGSVLDTMVAARSTGQMPITDPEATRFWWHIDEAVRFVDETLAVMQGGEVWVPKLPSSTVAALAQAIAPDAVHRVVGMRGAEKQHEQMMSTVESYTAWELPDRFCLLPYAGQPWSPEPPAGAWPAASGVDYSSEHHQHLVNLVES